MSTPRWATNAARDVCAGLRRARSPQEGTAIVVAALLAAHARGLGTPVVAPRAVPAPAPAPAPVPVPKPAKAPKRPYTPEVLAVVGVLPDPDAAARLGVCVATVRRWREALGRERVSAWPIKRAARAEQDKAVHAPVKAVPWYDDPAIIARFGVDTDAAIATSCGVTKQAVHNHRSRRGITHNGITPTQRRNLADLAKIKDRLGIVSDLVLAGEVGRCVDWVEKRRRALGIPSQRVKPPSTAQQLIAQHAGRQTDADVAQIAGVHLHTVVRYRHRNGIPAHRTTKGEP